MTLFGVPGTLFGVSWDPVWGVLGPCLGCPGTCPLGVPPERGPRIVLKHDMEGSFGTPNHVFWGSNHVFWGSNHVFWGSNHVFSSIFKHFMSQIGIGGRIS